MRNLALAAICGVFHFEFATDDEVDPDVAVHAMEEIFFHLQRAATEERAALVDALNALKAGVLASDRDEKTEMIQFYDTFLSDLTEDADE